MVVRLNGTTGEPFKSCQKYPKCNGTRPFQEIVLGDGLTISGEVFQKLAGKGPTEPAEEEARRRKKPATSSAGTEAEVVQGAECFQMDTDHVTEGEDSSSVISSLTEPEDDA